MTNEPKPLTRKERELIVAREGILCAASAAGPYTDELLRYEATLQQAEAEITRLKAENARLRGDGSALNAAVRILKPNDHQKEVLLSLIREAHGNGNLTITDSLKE